MNLKSPVKIEEIFKSRGRVRVLKILAKGELNITAICTETGIGNVAVARHLDALTAMGILQEKRFGRIRIFRLCIEDPHVQNIKTLLADWEDRS
jgi:DNA-binding transcriptional ArsR family regulator